MCSRKELESEIVHGIWLVVRYMYQLLSYQAPFVLGVCIITVQITHFWKPQFSCFSDFLVCNSCRMHSVSWGSTQRISILSTYFVPSPEHTKINSTSVRRLLCTETFRKRDTSFHLRQGLNFCILFASLKAHLWTRLQQNRAGLTVKNAPSSVESRSMTEFRSLGLA